MTQFVAHERTVFPLHFSSFHFLHSVAAVSGLLIFFFCRVRVRSSLNSRSTQERSTNHSIKQTRQQDHHHHYHQQIVFDNQQDKYKKKKNSALAWVPCFLTSHSQMTNVWNVKKYGANAGPSTRNCSDRRQAFLTFSLFFFYFFIFYFFMKKIYFLAHIVLVQWFVKIF